MRTYSFSLFWIVFLCNFLCNFAETAMAEPHRRVSRVVDGYQAKSESLPWMAHIHNGITFCSGALIDNRWLMTARHCVMDKAHLISASEINYSIFGLDGNRRPFRHAHEVYVYPGYSEDPIVDGLTDFALIKTEGKHHGVIPLTLNLEFVPDSEIRSLNSDSIEKTTYSYIAGWGYTRSGSRVSTPVLHWGVTPLQEVIQLDKHFVHLHSNFQDDHFDAHWYLLAGNSNGDFLDDCFGDSGGPLWLANSINSADATAIGIAISGTNSSCGKAGNLGIYLRLSVVKDFILSTIGPNNN